MTEESKEIIGEYSKERLLDAEILIQNMIKLVGQLNHFGKDPSCPMCHCIIDAGEYYKKWIDIEQFKKDHADCLEDMIANTKRVLMQ